MDHGTTNAPSLPAPAPAPAPTLPAADSAAQNYRQKLDAGEKHWMWKVGLRGLTIILGIIGIGCMGWILSTALVEKGYTYDYEYDDGWSGLWPLITFGISVIWGSVCILVLLLRKKPVHPGVAVGLDLVLWLAYIPTMMFAILGVISVLEYGSDGIIGRYSSSGYYYHADNGTWVWNSTEYDSYYGRSRACAQESNRLSRFDLTCEEQDAYINELWASKPHRAGVEITGTVCQALVLLLHFALFVWACVDTHYRNSRNPSKEAEQLAADIVMRAIESGALIRAPAQPQQRPMQFQQQFNGPHRQQPMAPAGVFIPPGSALPMAPQPAFTNQHAMTYQEKGDSSRFA